MKMAELPSETLQIVFIMEILMPIWIVMGSIGFVYLLSLFQSLRDQKKQDKHGTDARKKALLSVR